jgi:hypothetical protein
VYASTPHNSNLLLFPAIVSLSSSTPSVLRVWYSKKIVGLIYLNASIRRRFPGKGTNSRQKAIHVSSAPSCIHFNSGIINGKIIGQQPNITYGTFVLCPVD